MWRHWLQSQLALIELDIEKAQHLLSRASIIAEERGLERLKQKISKTKGKVENKTIQLTELGEIGSSISQRMEIVELENTLTEIKKERMVDSKVEQPTFRGKLFSLKI